MRNDLIGNKVYRVWRDYVMFGTVIDSKVGDGKWRFVLVDWVNADTYNSSMPDYDSAFDPNNDWVRVDKIRELDQRKMIEHIKNA